MNRMHTSTALSVGGREMKKNFWAWLGSAALVKTVLFLLLAAFSLARVYIKNDAI